VPVAATRETRRASRGSFSSRMSVLSSRRSDLESFDGLPELATSNAWSLARRSAGMLRKWSWAAQAACATVNPIAIGSVLGTLRILLNVFMPICYPGPGGPKRRSRPGQSAPVLSAPFGAWSPARRRLRRRRKRECPVARDCWATLKSHVTPRAAVRV
jgi:hypothetical protein